MPNRIASLDFNDTFLDYDHLKQSFPDYEMKSTTGDCSKLVPPFRYVSVYLSMQHNLAAK